MFRHYYVVLSPWHISLTSRQHETKLACPAHCFCLTGRQARSCCRSHSRHSTGTGTSLCTP